MQLRAHASHKLNIISHTVYVKLYFDLYAVFAEITVRSAVNENVNSAAAAFFNTMGIKTRSARSTDLVGLLSITC